MGRGGNSTLGHSVDHPAGRVDGMWLTPPLKNVVSTDLLSRTLPWRSRLV